MATYNGSDKRLGYLFQNGGGGGSSTLDGLSDVSLTTPTDGQVLSYDANADEWVNSSTANPSSIASMSDTDIQSPTDGQTLVYNSTSAKWENASGGASGHTYSTTEQVVGTWVDGKPIYECTFDLSASPVAMTYNSWANTGITITGCSKIINVIGMGDVAANCPIIATYGSELRVMTQRNSTGQKLAYITVQYLKSNI